MEQHFCSRELPLEMLCLSLEGSHKILQVVLEKEHVQLFLFTSCSSVLMYKKAFCILAF